MSAEVDYLLDLGDDALIYAQRLGEWVSRAPQIEEDMALANIALDLLGQARALLTRAGELEGEGRDEDALAYFRDERDFRCVHLVEQEGAGDFAFEMARMLWFATYQKALYTRLQTSTDEVLAGIAAKALKEVTYHRDHAEQWVMRLGDGTPTSTERMQVGLATAQPYVAELLEDDDAARAAAESGLGVLPSELEDEVRRSVADVVARAGLTEPEPARWRSRDGRRGVHSQVFGYVLAEMQHVARSHPGATW